jgi:hypothetical protein
MNQVCGLHIQNPENGSPVDPSADTTQYLANCVKAKAEIDAYQVADYNKKNQ